VYERHGVIVAKPGQRAALLAILRDAAASAPAMTGCRKYEVRTVAGDVNAIAVDEVAGAIDRLLGAEDPAQTVELPVIQRK